MSDVEIARRVGVSPRSVGRWRRAWENGTDWSPATTSLGSVAGILRRRLDER